MSDKVEALKQKVRDIQPGTRWHDEYADAVVLSVVDSYVTYQRPVSLISGALHVYDFLKRFEKSS